MRFYGFSLLRAVAMALLVLTAGCAGTAKDETISWSVQKLYGEAKQRLNSGSLVTARNYYTKLLARYPFGRYAQQANLDMIQLEYKDREYDKAVAQADKFLQLYPRSPYADYARYMKGVIAYSRDVSVIDRLMPTNIAQSDQALMRQAYENFEALVAQSPDSEYADDAKLRMVFLRNVSAEHEIYVAEYYLRRGNYLAAANRGQYVLENYQTTPSAPLALAIMVRAYQALEMTDLANDAKRVLDLNYPDIAAQDERIDYILNGNIAKKDSFLRRATRRLLN